MAVALSQSVDTVQFAAHALDTLNDNLVTANASAQYHGARNAKQWAAQLQVLETKVIRCHKIRKKHLGRRDKIGKKHLGHAD